MRKGSRAYKAVERCSRSERARPSAEKGRGDGAPAPVAGQYQRPFSQCSSLVRVSANHEDGGSPRHFRGTELTLRLKANATKRKGRGFAGTCTRGAADAMLEGLEPHAHRRVCANVNANGRACSGRRARNGHGRPV